MTKILFFGLNNWTDLWTAWYDTSAPTVAAIIVSLSVALICCLFFYFLMPLLFKKKRFGLCDYLLSWLIDMLLTGGVSLIVAFKMVQTYVEQNSLGVVDPAIPSIVSAVTTDEITYAAICCGFAFVAFFAVSMVVRPFAPTRTGTTPFGSKSKNASTSRR